jgi:hypothetical protein
MLALGKHRGGEALDTIHREARNSGNLFEALAGTNPRLNITGGE